LAGLKALLEHRVALNLVPDRLPDNIIEHNVSSQTVDNPSRK
jgi:hypothetical protein